MKKYKRIFVIVLDSLGIGASHDSEKFGDINVDTLGHISQTVETFNIPNLQKMGLANLNSLKQVEKVVFSVGPYPFIMVKFGLAVLAIFICFGDKTSPPVRRCFTLLNIWGFSSTNWLNKGAVSHKVEILFLIK